jgi:hypothetical protein
MVKINYGWNKYEWIIMAKIKTVTLTMSKLN